MIALTTGIGGTSRLARLIGRTATAEMVLDGSPMTARRIYELGGLNRVVPEGQAVSVAVEWATRLAQRPGKALAALKQILIDNDDLNLTDALANEQRLFQSVVGTPEAIDAMGELQARFGAGATLSYTGSAGRWRVDYTDQHGRPGKLFVRLLQSSSGDGC